MKSALVISVRDNVATALQALAPGQRIDLGASTLIVVEPIAAGHKIALRAIPLGEPVIKYGSAIGTACADIVPGTHVHTHNVASSRGRGDLDLCGGLKASAAPEEAQAPGPQARLAEPPDDPPMRETGAAPATARAAATSRSST